MYVVTWEMVIESCDVLARMLVGKAAYGIPRGGTIVAGILSYRGIPMSASYLLPFPELVVVDDIADSGATLRKYKGLDCQTAALFVREGCDPKPDFYAKVIEEADYILLPWEVALEIEARLKLKGSFKGL